MEVFENLRKSSEIFGNLRKSKFSGSVEMKNLTHFTENKLEGIRHYLKHLIGVRYFLESRCMYKILQIIQSHYVLENSPKKIYRWRNAYLLKIGAKSFGDGIQLICKDTESNLGPFAGFKGCNYPEVSFFFIIWMWRRPQIELTIGSSYRLAFFFVSFSSVACRGHFFI